MTLLRSQIISILTICALVWTTSCEQAPKNNDANLDKDNKEKTISKPVYPSDIMPSLDKWKILLGDGTNVDNLVNFKNDKFFYATTDGSTDWVVYKTPNSGITSKNSSNTRTELHEKREWIPEDGGYMSGTCKVMHVSTSGDARAAASYCVVVGQIHSGEGHENEPLKIFYKKFPGHEKGSVFWNYEINTKGKNDKRWDFSTAIWGYDMSVVGDTKDTYPAEPAGGIELAEEFSYEVNVYEGIMYLTFKSEGHPTKTFTKNLVKTEYATKKDIPMQTQKLFVEKLGRDGVEREKAYAGEKNYYKQGAYNQTNGKDFADNEVWCTAAEIYGGDIDKQYANGAYTEVWFRASSLGPAKKPE